MNDREHPEPALLVRFLGGEASLAEKCAVVRHLLSGCRRCAVEVLPAWGPREVGRLRREMEG